MTLDRKLSMASYREQFASSSLVGQQTKELLQSPSGYIKPDSAQRVEDSVYIGEKQGDTTFTRRHQSLGVTFNDSTITITKRKKQEGTIRQTLGQKKSLELLVDPEMATRLA